MLPLIQNGYVQAIIALMIAYFLITAALTTWRYWHGQLFSKQEQRDLVDKINALLPQTQCGQCGFEGCLPYARAIAQGTPINQCPPGGQLTIGHLAQLLNEPPRILNPAHGVAATPAVAYIREDECIGCTKCIRACPVDAIIGGAKLMHTVIASECTGCDLCVDPCPVDCIDMLPLDISPGWRWRLPSQLPTLAFPADNQR